MPSPSRESSLVVSAAFVAGATELQQLPPPVAREIAFAGRSNVGKSSLLNCLMERQRLVRTSSTPGCTRQLSFFEATLRDGARLGMVDLPGYGYAKRSKAERERWADVIEAYLRGRATLAAVCVLVDVRRGLELEERELLELLALPARTSRPPLTVLLVATKLDKLRASERAARLRELSRLGGLPVHGVSAVTGAGREELWRALRRAAGLLPPAAEGAAHQK